ncbi:hypothetical protein M0R45_007012 [Rubus argutus]|uniref:Reverse transcriptase zinc-binding domain-containing protein n=1 Tax=Rubus argutus TaxID=59490 RepID=A0AAW1YSX4_RUBAR
MNNFLWEGSREGSKDYLINWKLVSKSKAKGGLEIGNLVLKNSSLLGKWLWRFPIEKESLWHCVIKSKYGYQANGWDANLVVRGSSRSPWKDISAGLCDFSKCVQLVVGDGRIVRFWEDIWIGDKPFCEIFPRLFRLSRLYNASIDSLVSPSTIPVDWNFGFRRNLNDVEALEVSGLLGLIERVVLQDSKKDTKKWNLETSGAFTCTSFRNFLCNENPYPNFDPAKFVWESKVLPKVKFLGWLMAHGRLNTCEMLQRRRPNSCFSPHWCVLCKQNEESTSHIFLQCELASHLWQKLYWEAGLTWDF